MTSASPAIKFGCDPEFALFDKKINRLVSAHGLIPGTKAAPHKVKGGAIQVDGMMVEFNIDPCTNGKAFTDNVKLVLGELRELLPEDRYDFIYNPSIFFDPGYMKELPTEATELGCSPDYNAWFDGGVNPRPAPPASVPGMRSCGGHIHIGWTEDADITDLSHRWDCCAVIRLLDTYILPMLLELEPDSFRQELYGKPGAFRPKSYGVEWRTPSNVWLRSSDVQVRLIEAIKELVELSLFDQKLVIPKKFEEPEKIHSLIYAKTLVGPSLFLPSLQYLNGAISRERKANDNSVVTGIRVASSSGKVDFDLNLDVVPVKGINLNYTNTHAVDKKYLNPVIR